MSFAVSKPQFVYICNVTTPPRMVRFGWNLAARCVLITTMWSKSKRKKSS